MTQKLTKDGFVLLTLINLLDDQGVLLRHLLDNNKLKHLLPTPDDEAKLNKNILSVIDATEVMCERLDEGTTNFTDIFPKPIKLWSKQYTEILEENINMLLLEIQTYSLFHYRIIYEVLNRKDYAEISAKLNSLFKMIYLQNEWQPGDIINLQKYRQHRLTKYLEVFRSTKKGTDLIKFGKIANRYILKNNTNDIVTSTEFINHTMSLLDVKKNLFEEYKKDMI